MALFVLLILFASLEGVAQIDSRNQQTNPQPIDRGVPGEVVKKKKRKKRIKVISNKKQKKRSRKSFRKSGEVPYEGTIYGTPHRAKSTSRRTYARPAPDPYANRRIRTEADRASPRPPRPITQSRKGERPYRGDIAGQNKIRQRGTRSARRVVYPQPNPYSKRKIRTEGDRAYASDKQRGNVRSPSRSARRIQYPQPNPYRNRKIRTEKDRAYSNKRQRRSIRSSSSPRESRVSEKAGRPASASGGLIFSSKKKNVYRNHERRKPEQSSGKDIAGKKLRRKNYRSDPPSEGARSVGVNPYSKRRAMGEGERFSGYKGAANIRQTPRSGERATGKNLRGKANLRTRNFRSSRPTFSNWQAKPTRSSANARGGESARFGKSRSAPVRSVSDRPRNKSSYKRMAPPISASGVRRSYKQKNPYREKDKRFAGENAFGKDIAGKSLRRRNYRSPKPGYSGYPIYSGAKRTSSVYQNYKAKPVRSISSRPGKRYPQPNVRSATRTSPSSYKAKPIVSSSGDRWNNRGNALPQKLPRVRGTGSFRGKYKSSIIPNYGDIGVGTYQGKQKGRPPLTGGGSISRSWNNNGRALPQKLPRVRGAGSFRGRHSKSIIPSYGDEGVGTYQGNRKSQRPLKGAGGSITRRWNNQGQPLRQREYGKKSGVGTFRGKHNATIIPSYGDDGVGTFQGNRKAQRPLKGAGGSITRRWNNQEQPLQKREYGKKSGVGTFRGKHSANIIPSYGDDGVGTYQGNRKARKPLKGAGGSITRRWNNQGQPLQKREYGKKSGVGTFRGKHNASIIPSYGDDGIGTYQGNRKAVKPLKGAGGSITTQWNNDGKPLRRDEPKQSTESFLSSKRIPVKKPEQSKGSEYGRVTKIGFLKFGEQGGYMREPTKINKKYPGAVIPKVKRTEVEQSEGTELGRRRALSFLKIGDPSRSGLMHSYKGWGKQKVEQAEGSERGRVKTLSFWALGNPTQGGFEKPHSVAKKRLHPSSYYVNRRKPLNSIEEKEKTLKFRIWWAKVFRKNAGQPDAVKAKERKPRYDKGEQNIWETMERPDWYK